LKLAKFSLYKPFSVFNIESRQVTMYFLLVSFIYLTFAQISVKNVSEQGFFIQIDQINKLRGDRVYWVAHSSKEALSIKELMNGVSSLGLGCSGEVTIRQLTKRPRFEVQCKLEFGKQYTLEALIIKAGEDHQILTADFDFSYRRRLLNTPSKSPVTSSPTTAPVVSAIPSRAPVTSAPTSNGAVNNPSAYPSAMPSSIPSVVSSTSTTTEATIPIKSTSMLKEDDGSTFAGFDLSSGGGISLFVFAILLIVAVLGLILGGPYLYRRYYTTFGAKVVEVSPKAAAKLSEMTKRSADLSKSKLASSSFRSESKIEIAPMKSEDKIALMDPVE